VNFVGVMNECYKSIYPNNPKSEQECKNHDAWEKCDCEQEVPEVIKKFREKFQMTNQGTLMCQDKLRPYDVSIADLEQFILQAYQAGVEEVRERKEKQTINY